MRMSALEITATDTEAPPAPAGAPGGAAARHDAALLAELLDTLRHDVRTRFVTLDIKIDGGVAHIHGEVENSATRSAVSRLARRVEGIHAVWDFIRLPGQRLEVVDIGCGGTKQVPWAIGIDHCAQPGVDIVTDLERPLPLTDASVDHVLAIHVVEHITNFLELMDDIHRVLRPSGTLHVMAPDWRAVTAIADPTHRRYLAAQTFKYFCEPHGCRLWGPLKVAGDGQTVFADLRPLRDGGPAPVAGVARWLV